MRKMLCTGVLILEFAWGQAPADEVKALGNPGQAPVLAQRWVEESRRRVQAVGEVLASENLQERRKARAVLNDLEELVLPWLTSTQKLRPEDEAWRLRTLAEESSNWQRKAAQAIERQLANRTRLPVDPEARSEEPPPTLRICDEAYRAMLILLQGNEVADRNMPSYLQSTEARRDVLIQSQRQSASWRKLVR